MSHSPRQPKARVTKARGEKHRDTIAQAGARLQVVERTSDVLVPSRDTIHVHLRANRKPKVDQRLLHLGPKRADTDASGSGAPKHPPYMYTVKGKAFMSISFAWNETQSPRMHLSVRRNRDTPDMRCSCS